MTTGRTTSVEVYRVEATVDTDCIFIEDVRQIERFRHYDP